MPEPAHDDLKVLYHRGFDQFGALPLWNMRRFDEPLPEDALALVRQRGYSIDWPPAGPGTSTSPSLPGTPLP